MMNNSILNNIRETIKKKTGIVLMDDRLMDLEIVLQSRFQKNNKTPEEYISFLNNNYDEIIILASNFTIQETSFYRNKSHFDWLKFEILPYIINQRITDNKRELLILSAGCATGEEPYTLAMILSDLISNTDQWDIHIIGTDINADVLDFAKNGEYSKYKLRNIDASYIDRYFEKIGTGTKKSYKLNKNIKRMVRFRQCNLIREPFELSDLNNVDIILCENVIIYFNNESIQRLITNFHHVLADNGYLFLGYSETLNLVNHNFALTWWQESFAYQKDKNKHKKKDLSKISSCDVLKKDEIIEDLLTLDKKSYEEIIYLLLKYCDEKKVDNCIAIVEALKNGIIETDECFYIIKAEYLLNKNEIIDAANACRKAMSVNPLLLDAHIMLGHIYLKCGMNENAEFEIKTSLFIDKTSVLAWYLYAMHMKGIGKEKEHEEYMKKARELFIENNYKFKTKLFPVLKHEQQDISNIIMKADI